MLEQLVCCAHVVLEKRNGLFIGHVWWGEGQSVNWG